MGDWIKTASAVICTGTYDHLLVGVMDSPWQSQVAFMKFYLPGLTEKKFFLKNDRSLLKILSPLSVRVINMLMNAT